MLTTANDLQQLRIPSLLEPLEEAARALRKLAPKNMKPGKRARVKLPDFLRPRSYAEGMRHVWYLTDQVIDAAGNISSDLRKLCLTLVRAELGENAATGS